MPTPNSWIKVQHRITLNAKIERFADLVDLQVEHAVGNLVGFWTRIIEDEKYESGDVTALGLRGIELRAGWRGERGVFAAAMIEVGLLDRSDDGSLLVHDWSEYAGAYLAIRCGNRTRQRKRRGVDVTCDVTCDKPTQDSDGLNDAKLAISQNPDRVTCDVTQGVTPRSHVTPLSFSRSNMDLCKSDQPSGPRSGSGERQPNPSSHGKPSRDPPPGEKAINPFKKAQKSILIERERVATQPERPPNSTPPIPPLPVGEIQRASLAPANALSRVESDQVHGQLSVEVSSGSEGLSWSRITEVMQWDFGVRGSPSREAASDLKESLQTCTVTRADLDQAYLEAIAWITERGSKRVNATIFMQRLDSILRTAALEKARQQKINEMGIKIESSTENIPLHRLSFHQQDELLANTKRAKWAEDYGEHGDPLKKLEEIGNKYRAEKIAAQRSNNTNQEGKG